MLGSRHATATQSKDSAWNEKTCCLPGQSCSRALQKSRRLAASTHLLCWQLHCDRHGKASPGRAMSWRSWHAPPLQASNTCQHGVRSWKTQQTSWRHWTQPQMQETTSTRGRRRGDHRRVGRADPSAPGTLPPAAPGSAGCAGSGLPHSSLPAGLAAPQQPPPGRAGAVQTVPVVVRTTARPAPPAAAARPCPRLCQQLGPQPSAGVPARAAPACATAPLMPAAAASPLPSCTCFAAAGS